MLPSNPLTGKIVQSEPITILIVDDRPENLLTLESIIEKESRRIVKANGGNEALRIAIKENIGLIMLDIQMPEIDGIEVARLLRSNKATRHIPIIFVSAINTAERACMNGFEEGTVDCLYKPLNMEETRSKVAHFEKEYMFRLENNTLKAIIEKQSEQFDQFVYIVSHDLKAPLRAIDNLTNWISDDLGGTNVEGVNENLVLMRSRVNRMRSLLDGVLEFSRCGRINEQPETINTSHLVHAVFESLTPTVGFRIEAKELPSLMVESTRLYGIFFHLVKNAIIHHHDPAFGVISVTCESHGDKLVFAVTDNGPGIKPQYSQKIFEFFSTLKSKDDLETTGIGLPIVRKMLTDIGENIWLDTEILRGTRMKFTLPGNLLVKI